MYFLQKGDELGTGQRAVMLCGWQGNRSPGGK